MNRAGLIILWLIVVALVLWFLWFGLSDFVHPRNALEYHGRNPMRPLFRLVFGLIMSGGLLITAGFITARKKDV